jgi:hypothetical protein
MVWLSAHVVQMGAGAVRVREPAGVTSGQLVRMRSWLVLVASADERVISAHGTVTSAAMHAHRCRDVACVHAVVHVVSPRGPLSSASEQLRYTCDRVPLRSVRCARR